MIITVVVVSIVILLLGYIFYGRFLANHLQLNDSNPTPACTINDGVDYVPAKPAMLLGQHLSAISAAGPIVGSHSRCDLVRVVACINLDSYRRNIYRRCA